MCNESNNNAQWLKQYKRDTGKSCFKSLFFPKIALSIKARHENHYFTTYVKLPFRSTGNMFPR